MLCWFLLWEFNRCRCQTTRVFGQLNGIKYTKPRRLFHTLTWTASIQALWHAINSGASKTTEAVFYCFAQLITGRVLKSQVTWLNRNSLHASWILTVGAVNLPATGCSLITIDQGCPMFSGLRPLLKHGLINTWGRMWTVSRLSQLLYVL